MVTPTPEDYVRAGELIIRTRSWLNPGWRRRQDFARDTGLGLRTISDIERGRLGKRRGWDPPTISTIERAIGWAAGSYERVLAGQDPIIVSGSATPPALPEVITLRIDDIRNSDSLTDAEKDKMIAVLLQHGYTPSNDQSPSRRGQSAS